jgi:hypothetical protein
MYSKFFEIPLPSLCLKETEEMLTEATTTRDRKEATQKDKKCLQISSQLRDTEATRKDATQKLPGRTQKEG